MTASNVGAIYKTATKKLTRLVLYDTDAQGSAVDGPCKLLSGESILFVPIATWNSNPTLAAIQAILNGLGGESANNTTIPSASQIQDSFGNIWTLVATGGGLGNQIQQNGVTDPVTQNVTLLLYLNHVVWQNAFVLWWSWTNNMWQPVGGTTDPRVPTRNFLLGIYNYARSGNQTPYHTHTSAGPKATPAALRPTR